MKSNVRLRGGAGSYVIFAALVLASAVAAIVIGWSAFGRQIDEYAYDFLFRLEQPKPWQPSSIILAIDERTLSRYGGIIGMRAALADGLDHIRPVRPAAVAVDLILAEPGQADDKLEMAFAKTRNLVLSSDMRPDGSGWEDPIPRFRKYAVGVGEVHSDLDKYDAVNRSLPLEMADRANQRRWALALQTFLAVKGGWVLETPSDLTAGGVRIPSDYRTGRTIRIRYAPLAMDGIPRVSIADLDGNGALASRFAGKVVFAGVTAQTAVRDRWMTPYSNGIVMPGIEMHANAYETIARSMFLVDTPLRVVVAVTFLFAIFSGMAYALTSGWVSTALSVAILLVSQLPVPAIAFAHSNVWPWAPGTAAVLIAATASAAWRHLLVRRELMRAEREKVRYQHTIQFVTHEIENAADRHPGFQ